MNSNPGPTPRGTTGVRLPPRPSRASRFAEREARKRPGEHGVLNERTLLLGTASLVMVIALVLGAGWIWDNRIVASQEAANVFGDRISLGSVAAEAKLEATFLEANAGPAGKRVPAAQQQVEQQKRGLPDQALQALVTNAILGQEAARRGINVTPADIDAREQQDVAQYSALQKPTPSATPTSTGAAALDGGATLAAVSTPDGGATATGVPSPTAQPTPAGTSTPLPTLEPSTFQTELQALLKPSGLPEATYREQLRLQLVQSRVSQAIADEVPTTQEEVHARHILVADQAAAEAARARVVAGEDFAVVAMAVSTDPGSKAKGGDLGWFPRGIMNKQFEDVTFGLAMDKLSDAFQSPNGWHVVQVLEKDANRAVDPSQLATLQRASNTNWLTKRKADPAVKYEMNVDQRDWVLRQIGVRP